METTKEVLDLRSGDRWWLVESIVGSFGTAEVTLVNVAEQGAHVVHAQPLRLAARGRLRFRRGEIAANVTGMVVWSHLSKTPNEKGKFLYESGVRIEPDGDDFARVLEALASNSLLRYDDGSLDRKRERLAQRSKAAKPAMKFLHIDSISPDHLLLVRQARERLRAHPDEAIKWYNRAKYALDAEAMVSNEIPYREEVIAVWEYLEHSVPLPIVVRVFERG